MSWGHRPSAREMVPNSRVLDEAALAIVKAVRVDRTHDVPYVGSCSLSGQTIYIDYELPAHLTSNGKRYDVDRYIVMHEVVEMLFEHHLKFSYRDAHQIATQAERALVVSDGLSWASYSRFCRTWSNRIAARRSYPNPPPDIDLQPEHDECDTSILRRMKLPKSRLARSNDVSRRRSRD